MSLGVAISVKSGGSPDPDPSSVLHDLYTSTTSSTSSTLSVSSTLSIPYVATANKSGCTLRYTAYIDGTATGEVAFVEVDVDGTTILNVLHSAIISVPEDVNNITDNHVEYAVVSVEAGKTYKMARRRLSGATGNKIYLDDAVIEVPN